MKKMLILAVLVVALVALSANVALAGGWWKTNTSAYSTNTGPTGATTSWTADGVTSGQLYRGDAVGGTTGSPHGGFSTSTNYCKTCHAVHLAGADSYRLLKDGSTTDTRSSGEGADAGLGNKRSTECMYCHDATAGMTKIRPFALGELTTIRGEHTMGATVMPDATSSSIPDRGATGGADANATLQCYQCHSVHGAKTLGDNADRGSGSISTSTSAAAAAWDVMILRLDPNKDNVDLAGNAAGTPDDSSVSNSGDALKTAFCGDCHNANINWDASGTSDSRASGNNGSHVQGSAADGTLEVYGDTIRVAASDLGTSARGLLSPTKGCRACHNSRDSWQSKTGSTLYQGDGSTSRPETGLAYESSTTNGQGGIGRVAGSWPHQTQESKMIGRDIDSQVMDSADTSGVKDDAARALENMDRACLACHQWNGGTEGVEKTF